VGVTRDSYRPMAMDPAPPTTHVELRSVRGYDQHSIERFITSARAERNRTSAGIEAAKLRKLVAEHQLAGAADLHSRLGAMVIETQQRLAVRREQTTREVEAIMAKADLAAAARLAAAHAEAVTLRDASANMRDTPAGADVIDLSQRVKAV
jgi:hypothetical protein